MSPNERRESVRLAYSAAAEAPDAEHPFPLGAAFACDLGYPRELLRRLPDEAVDAFAGVSSVSIQAPLCEGLGVLDLGCGAGLDSLVAAERVGPTGRVVGIDLGVSTLERRSIDRVDGSVAGLFRCGRTSRDQSLRSSRWL